MKKNEGAERCLRGVAGLFRFHPGVHVENLGRLVPDLCGLAGSLFNMTGVRRLQDNALASESGC